MGPIDILGGSGNSTPIAISGPTSSADSTVGGGIISGGSAFQVPFNFFTAGSTPPGPSMPSTDTLLIAGGVLLAGFLVWKLLKG